MNLTLIDLPGMTKVAVGNNFLILFLQFYLLKNSPMQNIIMLCLSYAEGQPESIVQDIDNMVRSYVDKVS